MIRFNPNDMSFDLSKVIREINRVVILKGVNSESCNTEVVVVKFGHGVV